MKTRKITLGIIIVLSLTLATTACSSEQTETSLTSTETTQTTPSVAPQETTYPVPSPHVPSQMPSETPGPTGEIEFEDDKLTYTYFDVVTESEVEATYDIEESTDPLTAPIDSVIQAFSLSIDNSIVNSVTISEGNIYIDFSSSIYSLGLGSSGEIAFLDAVANAYLSNVADAKAVYYTVDENNYSSGHIEFPPGEAYAVK